MPFSRIKHIVFVTSFLIITTLKAHQEPKLTVIIVIDQFAHHYLPKLKSHLSAGLKEMLDNGIVYNNAYHAHGVPETTPGHHAISTGTLPKDHGAVYNQWINEKYEKIAYADDNSPQGAMLNKAPQGQSPHQTKIEGFSDQFLNCVPQDVHHHVWALSLKSYPAIAMAQQKGKALWFDYKNGGFTSSAWYFKELPAWVTAFNRKNSLAKTNSVKWKTVHPTTHKAYAFKDATNYDFAGFPFSLITTPVKIDRSEKNPFEMYLKTPYAAQNLIDLAKTCISKNLTKASDHMLLWVSLSNLDLVGHYYGPDSMECIDTVYHLDKQIKSLMDFATAHVGAKKCLFVLTADHGICPIPELTAKRGTTFARRIYAPKLLEELNAHILKTQGIPECVKRFEPNFLTLNKEALATLHDEQKNHILEDIKAFLLKQKGIVKAWTLKDLEQAPFKQNSIEHFYQNQLYPERSGDIFCMPQAYCLITNYAKGTSHSSPYEYDTHVPLIVYQKGFLERKAIKDKVWITQLVPTLATLLHVQKPSAASEASLPGI